MKRNQSRLILLILLAPLSLLGATCAGKPGIKILNPVHGAYTTAASISVSGTVSNVTPASYKVVVNGVQATLNADKTWAVTLPVNAAAVVNPFHAELKRLSNNTTVARTRHVVIAGESVADGDFSLDGVALRINETGLDALEPLIASGVSIDPATLLPVGSVVISNYCAIPGLFGGCWGSMTARVANPPPSITGFAIDADSMTNFVTGDVDIFNLRIDLDLDGSGLAPDCGLRLTANNTQILGDYGLSPDPVDASNVDVNQIGSPQVSFAGFNQDFTYGLCDFPLIGNLIQLIIGNVEPTVVAGFEDTLDDPDGAGPADAAVADAIEVALADIAISGPIGDTLQVNLDTPLFDVFEDNDGITLGSDTRFTASPVSGTPAPGECAAVDGAPNLAASYHISETFPSFGTNTPIGNLPYNIAISISTSAFNQLLKAQIECGLLRTSLTEIDLGYGPIPVTAGLLSTFIPTLSGLDPELPMRIDLEPTLAPLLTGNAGPEGEIGEIRIPHLLIEVHYDDGIHTGNNSLIIRSAVDMRAGFDLTFDAQTGSLAFSVANVSNLVIAFLVNNVLANEVQLTTVLNYLLPQMLPSLGDGLGAFPLPEFYGLQLQSVEISRNGQFYTLFANLVPGP